MSEETFTADWLALREPVDHRSRAADLVAPVAEWWGSRPGQRVLDLGSGTGSNLRYLAPRLPGEQAWTLVDRDAALLEQATGEAVAVFDAVCSVRSQQNYLDRLFSRWQVSLVGSGSGWRVGTIKAIPSPFSPIRNLRDFLRYSDLAPVLGVVFGGSSRSHCSNRFGRDGRLPFTPPHNPTEIPCH